MLFLTQNEKSRMIFRFSQRGPATVLDRLSQTPESVQVLGTVSGTSGGGGQGACLSCSRTGADADSNPVSWTKLNQGGSS